jgi:hypothetical protein
MSSNFSNKPKWITYAGGFASIAVIIGVIIAYFTYTKTFPTSSGDRVVTPLVGSTTNATPLTTPLSLKKLTVNRQLECTSQCDTAVIQITVVSFTLDPTQNQTSMLLLLSSQHNYSNCHFVQSLTSYLVFQDAAGKTYDPSGQLNNEFSLVAGQPLMLTAIYSFLPSPGSTYTLLSSEIWGEGFSISGPIYGTTQFIF